MPFTFKYKRKGKTDPIFEDNLVCLQCKAKSSFGVQCKRTVCVGLDMCFSHMRKFGHLDITDSERVMGEHGLFATSGKKNVNSAEIIFKPRDIICYYKGEILTDDETIERYNGLTAPYVVGVKNEVTNEHLNIDASLLRYAGAYVHCLNTKYNARFKYEFNPHFKTKPSVFIEAIKPIYDGEEIIVQDTKNQQKHKLRGATMELVPFRKYNLKQTKKRRHKKGETDLSEVD